MINADEILTSICLRPGIKDADPELLKDMITDCIQEIRDEIHYGDTEELPDGLKGVIKELVCRKFNMDGAQGIQSESQSSGGTTTYMQDIPQSMKRQIYKYRRLRR